VFPGSRAETKRGSEIGAWMKRISKLKSYYREFRFVAKGLLSTDHPVLAHVIPVRRCNLACAYCNEYDDFSTPVPLEVMNRRIDQLADLGTSGIIISGGEPLLHPDLERIIAHIRSRKMLAALISNCYLMTRERIEGLNQAGLEYLQVSIDNVTPDDVSKKSLKVLDKKLTLLAELADFKINVNSVIGSGIRKPEDAVRVAERAVELGFYSSLGIIHDRSGSLKPLQGIERDIYFKLKRLGKKSWTRLNYFQDNLIDGKPNQWRCRAGARYLYICEDGLVHYCSQQRGTPGVPLETYTLDDIRREYRTPKVCADYCTIACVHQVATFDFWRHKQRLGAKGIISETGHHPAEGLYQIN
jgi:MoaA/NifB/PqqE/SkfB family radical SAM enzyme